MCRLPSLALSFMLMIAIANTGNAQSSDGDSNDEQIRKVVLFSMVPVVVAFSFIVFVFYRAKRESHFRRKEAEFRLSMAEIELKALRAQINPHFIFNCLNSIHHYMHQNNVIRAGDYLIKFSQLIRYVLETSASRMVPLVDDLEALKSYMELERLRLQSAFEFNIDTSAVANPEAIHIPPMIIQPFVENSIWHGLSAKGNGGRIMINVSRRQDMMQFVIEDNGNRKHEDKVNEASPIIKKTSMGMSLIKDRLSVVSNLYGVNASFKMEDRTNNPDSDGGTRITLLLPFDE